MSVCVLQAQEWKIACSKLEAPNLELEAMIYILVY
jgi:hypothetical protein